MTPILSVSQMRSIDQSAVSGFVEVGYEFMLKAGSAIADAVRRMRPDPRAGDIAVVCGKGNNGGDGYAAARLLLESGYGVMCFALCEGSTLAGEARMAFDAYVEKNGNILVLDDAADCGGFNTYALVVDALLGMGAAGEPRGLAADVIAAINASGKPVVAVDTPSGLDNDTGIPAQACVRATTTVTCGFAKIGAWFYPGRALIGELTVADLGYPALIVDKHADHILVPSVTDLRRMLPLRKPAGSKFDHGLVLTVAGSRGMTGCVGLASEAALRCGCGMVHCALPHSAVSSVAAHVVEPVLHPMDETPHGTLSPASVEAITELSDRMQCVCIGPGLSREKDTAALVRMLVSAVDKPMVLDADGINAFKGRAEELNKRTCDLVITPHRGEWERVFGPLPQAPLEVIDVLKRVATTLKLTILLKGNPTIVVDPPGTAYVLPYGTSALATAGSGDVLSGAIAGLIAQGASVTDAAILGTYLHGTAGALAAEELTDYGVIARDVVAKIPAAIRGLVCIDGTSS